MEEDPPLCQAYLWTEVFLPLTQKSSNGCTFIDAEQKRHNLKECYKAQPEESKELLPIGMMLYPTTFPKTVDEAKDKHMWTHVIVKDGTHGMYYYIHKPPEEKELPTSFHVWIAEDTSGDKYLAETCVEVQKQTYHCPLKHTNTAGLELCLFHTLYQTFLPQRHTWTAPTGETFTIADDKKERLWSLDWWTMEAFIRDLLQEWQATRQLQNKLLLQPYIPPSEHKENPNPAPEPAPDPALPLKTQNKVKKTKKQPLSPAFQNTIQMLAKKKEHVEEKKE